MHEKAPTIGRGSRLVSERTHVRIEQTSAHNHSLS